MSFEHLFERWENEPKSTGFRLVIPNPNKLYNFVLQVADQAGDKTRRMQMADFFESHRKGIGNPDSLVWIIDIKDDLLSDVNVVLQGGYNRRIGSNAWILGGGRT